MIISKNIWLMVEPTHLKCCAFVKLDHCAPGIGVKSLRRNGRLPISDDIETLVHDRTKWVPLLNEHEFFRTGASEVVKMCTFNHLQTHRNTHVLQQYPALKSHGAFFLPIFDLAALPIFFQYHVFAVARWS